MCRFLFALAAFGLALAEDPLQPLKAENPQAYEIVRALLSKSSLGLVVSQLHGGPVVDDKIDALRQFDNKSFLQVKGLLEKSKAGALVRGDEDDLKELKAENPSAYAIVQALLVKSRMGLPLMSRSASFLQNDEDDMKELQRENPSAYAIVEALLTRQRLGLIRKKDSFLQMAEDPLAPLQRSDPAAYAIVAALLKKAGSPAFLQTGWLPELEHVERTAARHVRVALSRSKLSALWPGSSLVQTSESAALFPEAYDYVKATLRRMPALGLLAHPAPLLRDHDAEIFLQEALQRSSTGKMLARGRDVSLVQCVREDPEAMLLKLAPVLDKLKSLDANMANALQGAMNKVEAASFVQLSAYEKRKALMPSLHALRAVDEMATAFLTGVARRSFHAGAGILLQLKDTPVDETLLKLAPVMDRLRQLDAKTFGLLNGMLDKAQPTAFLQGVDVEDRLLKLAPVLERLKQLDGKTFGLLNGMLDKAESEQRMSLIQSEPLSMPERLLKLQPILERLAGLDKAAFSNLSNIVEQVSSKMDMSFLQGPDVEETLMKLAPVLEHLKQLDGNAFGMLNGMLDKAEAAHSSSFVQVAEPEDAEEKLLKLAPVLQRLQQLDPKSFGLLNGMLDKTRAGFAFVQNSMRTDPADTLDRLAPILDRLASLDPKIAKLLEKAVAK